MPSLRQVRPNQWIGFVVAASALLPWTALLDWAAARYNTIHSFYADYASGLLWFRGALIATGVLCGLWPVLMRTLWEPRPERLVDRPHDRLDAILMGAIFAVALALRLIGATSSLQHDEWYIATVYVQHGPIVIATRFTGFTNHIFYSLMAWAGTKVFGMTEIGLRAPAILFGALAAPALYGALRWGLNRWASLFGGLVFALSTFSIYYSQEARGYSTTLFCVAALFGLVRELRDRPTKLALAVTIVIAVMLAYVRLWNIVLIAAVYVAVAVEALRPEGRPLLKRLTLAFLAAGAVVFLLYSITIPTVLEARRSGPELEAKNYPAPHEPLARDLTVPLLPDGVAIAAWVIATAGLIALSVRARLWLMIVLAMSALTVFTAGVTLSASRYSIHLLAPVVVAQAAALAWTWDRWKPAAAALGLALLAAHAVSAVRYHSQRKLDFYGAADYLSSQSETDRIGLAHDSKTVTFYIRRPERCVVVDERTVDKEDPDWVVTHTVTLSMEGRFASRIYRRYRETWSRETMHGDRLTIWRRTSPSSSPR